MRISSFRIRNYKSYLDSGAIQLSQGMNLVTGQNNAGKTALLQALELRGAYRAHRSSGTVPHRGQKVHQVESKTDFSITSSGKEVGELTEAVQRMQFAIPPSPGYSMPHPLGIPYDDYASPATLEKVWQWILSRSEITFNFTRLLLPNGEEAIQPSALPSHNLYEVKAASGGSPISIARQLGQDGRANFFVQYNSPGDDLGTALAPLFQERIYRFSTERFSLGECSFGAKRQLAPNASNLPEVLNALQGNAEEFSQYVALVKRVLPQVEWLSIEPTDDNCLRVLVWNIDRRSMRDDLAIRLSESGTGVGQVLAIMYVAFTSKASSVLLIDEPQSFLHPGAARTLIEVLKEFDQHQYVITTHSASVIAAAEAKEILILRTTEAQTRIQVADTADNALLREFLDEIGARLSDVFGLEHVVWVEGPTEAAIFPRLLKELKMMPSGTGVVSIRNTGDLESRDAKRIFEIYNNLTSKASILPARVTFLLDKELRNPEERNQLQKLSNGRLFFIPRRNVECFLLDSEAITAVCNGITGFNASEQLAKAHIEKALEALLLTGKYLPSGDAKEKASLTSPDVDGARLLQDLFRKLSDSRVEYRKTIHSVYLYEWLMKHKPSALEELSKFVVEVFSQQLTRT